MRTYRAYVTFTNRSQWVYEGAAENRASFLLIVASRMLSAGPIRRDPAAITIEPVGKAFRRQAVEFTAGQEVQFRTAATNTGADLVAGEAVRVTSRRDTKQ